MKKKLEADLISIAHRILQMKNKSDIVQLHSEVQKLYEKLSVLRFVDEHFAGSTPTFDYTKAEEHLAVIFENDIPTSAPEPEVTNEKESPTSGKSSKKDKQKPQESVHETEPEAQPVMEIEEPVSEESSEKEADMPAEIAAEVEMESESGESQEAIEPEAQSYDAPSPEIVLEAPAVEESPEENFITAVTAMKETPTAEQKTEIEKDSELEKAPAASISETPGFESSLFKPSFELSFDAKPDAPIETPSHPIKETQFAFDDLLGKGYTDPVFVKPEELEKERMEAPSVIPIARSYTENAPVISMNAATETLSMNERLGKGLTIGLNDRIAFMNHLFNNSSEDYNRVLSQLITFGTLGEARDFIDNMVKPDYNDWKGKEEYEQRFMEIIEKRFA